MFLRTGTLAALSLVLSSGALFAADVQMPISFRSASCFNVDLSSYPVITFHGPEVIDLAPFGPTLLDWSITVQATPFGLLLVDGTFAWHLKGELLIGRYSAFSLNPYTGDYTLDWVFEGGTGGFDKVTGLGQTLGVVDLTTYCAEFGFTGVLYGL